MDSIGKFDLQLVEKGSDGAGGEVHLYSFRYNERPIILVDKYVTEPKLFSAYWKGKVSGEWVFDNFEKIVSELYDSYIISDDKDKITCKISADYADSEIEEEFELTGFANKRYDFDLGSMRFLRIDIPQLTVWADISYGDSDNDEELGIASNRHIFEKVSDLYFHTPGVDETYPDSEKRDLDTIIKRNSKNFPG